MPADRFPERVLVSLYTMTTSDHGSIDRLDAALIELLSADLISLATQVPYRVLPLVRAAGGSAAGTG